MKQLTVPLLLTTLGLLAPSASADLLVGRLVTSTGTPVAFGDLDFRFPGGSGGNPATVNDGANALGQFAVTIPAGSYDVTFNPPLGTNLLGVFRASVAIAGTTNVGDIVLPEGVTLSGTVVNAAGVGVADRVADLNEDVEQADAPVSGLTHRYPDKALFLPQPSCPVYCRFCTRSYAVGAESSGPGAAAQGFRFVAVRAWRALQRMGQVQVGRA